MWRMAMLVVISLVPALGWAWFFREQDIYEKEPPRLLLLCFFAGMLAVLPAILLEEPFRGLMEQGSIGERLVTAFLVVGLGEEALKLLAVYLSVYTRDDFNEAIDGMIYSIMAALGFAAVENLLYTITFGIQVAPARALVSSLAHSAFSGLAGYHLGVAKFTRGQARWQIANGLVTAAFLHGLYNTLLMFELISPLGIIALLAGLYWWVFARFKAAIALSPFRHRLDDHR